MDKKKNILITGGVGFIGSNLAQKLSAEGHNVISIDDYSFGKKENGIAFYHFGIRFASCFLVRNTFSPLFVIILQNFLRHVFSRKKCVLTFLFLSLFYLVFPHCILLPRPALPCFRAHYLPYVCTLCCFGGRVGLGHFFLYSRVLP